MDILEKIVARTLEIVAQREANLSLDQLKERIATLGPTRSLKERVAASSKPHVISEFKRKSPSKPQINLGADPSEIAQAYEAGGASAMSVLTEPDFFGGSPDDLRAVRKVVDLPLLRKDFIVRPYQVYEAREMGADLILLIARCLTKEQMAEYTALAHQLGLEVLCEIHNTEELEVVGDAPVDFLGVNCRDLKKFDTNIERLIEIRDHLPKGVHLVAESGIHNPEAVSRLHKVGYELFLVGEYLMRAEDTKATLQGLIKA